MSTILYSNGWLVTDSSGVMKQYDTLLFTPTEIDKLVMSNCRTVAVAICGKALVHDNIIHAIANRLADFIKDPECHLSTDLDVHSYFEEITLSNKADFGLLLINTIDHHVYEIQSGIKEGEFELKIKTIRCDDAQSFGSGNFLAYAGVIAGLSPIEAVRQAIKYDMYSKLPIRSVCINDLATYTPGISL